MPDLFQNNQPNLQNDQNRPLADLLRPKIISKLSTRSFGQWNPLSRILKIQENSILIFLRLPGCGKQR